MIRSITTINRNMNILQKKQENTSANIANVNTPGYKFQDVVQSTLESEKLVNYAGGTGANQRQELGNFVFGNQIDEVYRNFEQGSLAETNKDTDFAMVGNGFFTVQLDNGQIAFTRNGNFKVNDQNQLVTLEGYPVLGIQADGQRTFIQIENNKVASDFMISEFIGDATLNSIGDTLFTSTQQSNVIKGETKQGFLEMSNVKVTDEMIKMIEIAREFESNQKLLHSADETLNKAVNEVGRV